MNRVGPVYPIVFLSGMCALVYEILWMRTFTPVFGLSIYATTTVLAAFMGGLGLGSILASRVLARWKGSYWHLYSLLELGIGVTAAAIPFTIDPITRLFAAAGGMDESGVLTSVVRFSLSFTVMIAPTLFMGLTLPVLIRALRDVSPEDRIESRRVGLLYGLNTLGGAVGCLLVGFVLIYQLGVLRTTFLTVAMNLLLAATVFLLYRRARGAETTAPSTADDAEERGALSIDEPAVPPALVLVLYGVIGVASFGYELSWFRILVFYLQSATYSLSLMLSLFLLGMGLGSFFFSRFIEARLRSRSWDTAGLLGLVQIAIGVLGASTFHIYVRLDQLWAGVIDTFGAGSWEMIAFQKGVIAGVIILPPTFLMGVTFPLLARLYKRSGVDDARTTAHLYAVNTFGAIVGTLLTGFVAFNLFGVQKTVAGLSIVSAAIGLVFASRSAIAHPAFRIARVALVAACGLLLYTTSPRALISHFEKRTGEILFYQESASDITFVHRVGEHVKMLAFNDGRGTSSTGIVNNFVNRVLAYSTMLLNPEAKDVLVISFGCGNTASAYTMFPIESLDIVDISSGAFAAAEYFETNLNVLDDPRVTTYVEDGRNYLLRTRKRYDIIGLELPTLVTDGIASLYTREFYEVAKAKLNPGGVLSQWVDAGNSQREASLMMMNTMQGVFPETTVWANLWSWWGNAIKDRDSSEIRYEAVKALFSSERVANDMRSVGTSMEDVLARLVASSRQLRITAAGSETLTDDRTIVDFLVPKVEGSSAFGGGVAYYTSPVRYIFTKNWAGDTDMRSALFKPMISFYPPAAQRPSVEASIREVAKGFPESSLEFAIRRGTDISTKSYVPIETD